MIGQDTSKLLRQIKQWLKRIPPLTILGVFIVRVLRGYCTYQQIMRECPEEEKWNRYFMDYEGSGDAYLTCGYLQSRGAIGSGDAFIGSGLSIKIAKLFPFERYVEVTAKNALTVRVMERFYGQKLKILPLLYESEYMEYEGVLRFMEGYKRLDFMTMLKVGLEYNVGLPYSEQPWIQPEFPYKSEELDDIFHTHNLVPGKTVLLAPYAGRHEIWGIPMEFYTQLTQQLQQAGYVVCTNSGNPIDEPPVPGTQPLLIPYRLIRPFCEKAGCFIGLRSGLCDIISASQVCKKIIFYLPFALDTRVSSFEKFFMLHNMGLCQDAMEIVLCKNDFRPIITLILRELTAKERGIGVGEINESTGDIGN